MAKNILIFSDGTGQAGGIRPEQRLSNIYKLYRATRVGPENSINPDEQTAFYDAGLGSNEIGDPLWVRPFSYTRKLFASATGSGISRNIADCYEAILQRYEPGDRIFLFGFSRGGYTVRCLANVIRHCGIPTHGRGDPKAPLPRAGLALRKIADEAVYKVYDHCAGRKAEDIVNERLELGRQFRAAYGSQHSIDREKSNASAYFIGVFDSVAALGMRPWMRYGALLTAAVTFFGFSALAALPISKIFEWSFWHTAFGLFALCGLAVATKTYRSQYKHVPGAWHKGHFAIWRGSRAQTDTQLDPEVSFARHALAIDERRYDFVRALWGSKSTDTVGKVEGVSRMKQIWFAGNHSDIGGSYPEDESRLSDIPLDWMIEEATKIPNPIVIDRSKLNLYPRADGMQHCEVEATRENLYPRWWPKAWRWSWKTDIRSTASGAIHHHTVATRYKLPAVQQVDKFAAYRPPSFIYDRRYYEECQVANAHCLPADFHKVWAEQQKRWAANDAAEAQKMEANAATEKKSNSV